MTEQQNEESKQAILSALWQSRLEQQGGPEQQFEHPEVPSFSRFGEGSDELLSLFKERLEIAGGQWHEVASLDEAIAIMQQKLPDAQIIASATGEWPGTVALNELIRPHDLENVDIGVIRAEFGVAEMGSVWLTEQTMIVNSIGFLPQHLVILLDPQQITENMHTAYQRVDLTAQHYGCFMMGPSATADIGATLVRGAQGARSLTVFFL